MMHIINNSILSYSKRDSKSTITLLGTLYLSLAHNLILFGRFLVFFSRLEGGARPTLTTIAIKIRVADLLQKKMPPYNRKAFTAIY